MSLARLRWLTVVVPLVFLLAVDVVRHLVWPELLHSWPGSLAILALIAAGVYLFSRAVFDYLEGVERQLIEQNRALQTQSETTRRQAAQLRALHEASVTVTSDLGVEAVLQRVVDLARELVNARYGALGVLDEQGRIVRFLTSGLSAAERAALGDPPKGRGLLGAVLRSGQPIRVDDIASDARSSGFPPGHPRMTTFLGVPITARGRTLGNLYLTDKEGTTGVVPFEPQDEELLQLFAAQAAVAIENARLHARVEALAAVAERERIARELHDSLAQVLGYVRLRATSARDALRRGDLAAAEATLEQIAAATDEAYADVREAILGLRSGVGAERGLTAALEEYLERYRLQTGISAVLEAGPGVAEARLAPGAEAQLLRIIQEALANVRKHAAARRAVVRLEVVLLSGGPRLRASVSDDGCGFDPAGLVGAARFGLATMRERAESVGGSCTIESAPGRGTRVTVELPLEAGPALSLPRVVEGT